MWCGCFEFANPTGFLMQDDRVTFCDLFDFPEVKRCRSCSLTDENGELSSGVSLIAVNSDVVLVKHVYGDEMYPF